jgi:hypothetical protein
VFVFAWNRFLLMVALASLMRAQKKRSFARNALKLLPKPVNRLLPAQNTHDACMQIFKSVLNKI